jgi:hypothetical protein
MILLEASVEVSIPILSQISRKRLRIIPRSEINLPCGSIVAVDRGYCDYQLFHQWDQAGVFFVTRLKDNSSYRVVEKRPVPQKSNALADQTILFRAENSPHSGLLRQIVVDDKANPKQVDLLSNHLDFGATTIARIYRYSLESVPEPVNQAISI